jgi:hypothetical protein
LAKSPEPTHLFAWFRPIQTAVLHLSRFRVARGLFVGVYRLALRLFLILLPQRSRTRAVYSKINWSDCWPGSSDLDLRIVLKDAGDSQQHFRTFKRQISFIRRYRRLFPMLNHVYVMGQPFATRLVSQNCTSAFGDGVRVWNRTWGEVVPECETITTRSGDAVALRDAFIQYSRELLPFFYRMPFETKVFSRRLYTSLINVLRHCLYYRGEIDSTTRSYEASLAHVLADPALGEYPRLAVLLHRQQSMAERDFRGSFGRAETEGALAELIAYLDGVSREALRGFRYDPFTLSALQIEDPLANVNRARVERVADGFGVAFDGWICSTNGVLPGQQTFALCRRGAQSPGAIQAGTLLDMHDDASVRAISPVIVSRDMFKLYLAINPHVYFQLAKYPPQPQPSEGVQWRDYGSSHAMLKRVLLNGLNLLSIAFRERDAARLLHLFIGVLPTTYLFFEKGLVCANLAECAGEYASAGFPFHERVADAYERYSRQGKPFTAAEAERTLDAYGASAMKLADEALAFF